MNVNKVNLCERWTGQDNLNCLPENLVFIEKLPVSGEYDPNYKIENLLKYCRVCGQVYREKIYRNCNGGETSSYYKISGSLVNQCHCIGYLIPVEIITDEKCCEGDSMYFVMEKETKMRCGKCGTFYKEKISQNNYDGFYYQKYTKF